MFQIRKQFNVKLHVAFLSLLLIMTALAWFTYQAVHWYELRLARFTSAQAVLRNLQELSALTFAELRALEDSRAGGGPGTSESDWEARAEQLRDAVFELREGTFVYAAVDPSLDGEHASERVFELAQTVDGIIQSGTLIRQAIAEGRTRDAAGEWDGLVSSGIVSDFAGQIDSAIDEQILRMRSIDVESAAYTRYLAGYLPALLLLLVFLTLGLALLFSRSLTRSLNALRDGARAISDGELDHRIPRLKEQEFQLVAETMNKLARELSDHRKRLHEANAKLDALVEERTRALTEINRKLAKMDLTRRRLLADISHEFRTPLTVIKGESDVVLRGGSKPEAEYRAAIHRILEQADHASHVVDDLLFIARADAGEPRLEMRPLSVFRMVRSLCKEFAATAGRNNLAIEQHIKGPDVVVLADAKRLRQVFVNLMNNALRYSKPGGTVEVYGSQLNGEVQIQFRDYGIGLSDEDAEHAFDRFYRGRRAQQHAKGTGLGLPVAKAIVEAHNGSISLKGRLEVGATATVILPVPDHFKGG